MKSAKCVRRDTGRLLALACLFLGPTLAPTRPAQAEEAHPGQRIETLYSEAVIAFNKKDYKRALAVLEELLKLGPDNLEALQLKALALKSGANDAEAVKAYNRLLKLRPEKDRGPYYFELGVIYDRHKKPQWARPYFQRSILRGFNVEASHLFLGLALFNAGDPNGSEPHFDVVADSSSPEMRAIGRYYRALILLKAGSGSLGLGDLLEARESAEAAQGSAIAKNIAEASAKMLAPFDKPQWFGNLTLFPQFDSNLSQASIQAGATGVSAAKINLSGGFGRVGSPMGAWQAVASLRGTANYNVGLSGSGANDYQYLTATPSLYLSRKPMGRRVFGLKMESTVTGQYGGTSAASALPELYSVTGDLGAFYRLLIGRSLQLQFDLGSRPQYFFTAPDFTAFDNGYLGFGGKVQTESAWLNPSFSIGGEYNGASGTIATYAAGNAALSDTLRLGADDQSVLSANGTYYAYFQTTSPSRKDLYLLFRLTHIHSLSSQWSISFDGSFLTNASSDPAYTYSRYTAGLGMSWSL